MMGLCLDDDGLNVGMELRDSHESVVINYNDGQARRETIELTYGQLWSLKRCMDDLFKHHLPEVKAKEAFVKEMKAKLLYDTEHFQMECDSIAQKRLALDKQQGQSIAACKNNERDILRIIKEVGEK